ncbi:hypothetical protein C8250_042055 [Streptomyces sp. So13.3]|uniref:hypothetical protein n=1 Tax=Streptomyces TaxID=1883 RepID=UPI00110646C5|nr:MULTISPECIES: hypothetical protein [Streptomyces]MCZ4102100.1 hypothetical protein [Streptomyces sp. H39-C1]QNA77511.1 hypothetical protein C8250_042055 [Streptomyces sp. So13.3]
MARPTPATQVNRQSRRSRTAGVRTDVRLLSWLTTLTGLLSVIAVVILTLTDHGEAAVAVGVIGGAMGTAGGIQVTVNIRR